MPPLFSQKNLKNGNYPIKRCPPKLFSKILIYWENFIIIQKIFNKILIYWRIFATFLNLMRKIYNYWKYIQGSLHLLKKNCNFFNLMRKIYNYLKLFTTIQNLLKFSDKILTQQWCKRFILISKLKVPPPLPGSKNRAKRGHTLNGAGR